MEVFRSPRWVVSRSSIIFKIILRIPTKYCKFPIRMHVAHFQFLIKNHEKTFPKGLKNRLPLGNALRTPKNIIFMLKTSIFGSPENPDFFV